jgi:hypothetical protein
MPITRDTQSRQLLHMKCPECKFFVATAVHYFVQEREVKRFKYETTITCGNQGKCEHSSSGTSTNPETAMMNAWWGYQR